LASQTRSDLIVTDDSDIVTAHSDNSPKSVTIKSESAVTTRGITGHTISESAVTLGRNPHPEWQNRFATHSEVIKKPAQAGLSL
jgi:hypothetical protein